MNSLPLEEVANIFSGNSINSKLKKDKYTDKNFPTPYVATKDLSKNGDFEYNNGVTIPNTELGNFKIAPKGSTLICMEGGSAGKKIGLIDRDVCFVNKLGALVPNEKINSKYLYYSLQTVGFQAQFQSSLTGLIGGVSLSKLKKLRIPVPPLQEQEKIVERLNKVFKNISEKLKIEKFRKEELITLSNSIYDELFNFNSENLTELSNLVEFENGDRGKNYPSKKYRVSSGIPFINAGNFDLDGEISEEKMEFITDEHYNKLSRGKVKKNDFLLCIRGSLGKFALNKHYSKAAIASSLVIIRLKNLDNIEMLDKYFRSSFFKKQITKKSGGTAQPNLGANQLKDFLIPISLSKEELFRTRKIDILLKQFFENNQKVTEKLTLLKKSVLNKEFLYE